MGTAHGTQLEGLLKNLELNSLVGGVHQASFCVCARVRMCVAFVLVHQIPSSNCLRYSTVVARSGRVCSQSPCAALVFFSPHISVNCFLISAPDPKRGARVPSGAGHPLGHRGQGDQLMVGVKCAGHMLQGCL